MWKLRSIFYILRKSTPETPPECANAFCKVSVSMQHILGPKWEVVLHVWQLFEYSRCET